MRPLRSVIALMLCSQLLAPLPAAAQARSNVEQAPQLPAIEPPVSAFADGGQRSLLPKPASGGRRLLRNTLIGAAIGGTLAGILARGLGDCGDCGGDTAKTIASGAMYGALIGAAINIRPARRPSQGQSWQTTIGSKVTKRMKSVQVAVRF